VDRDQHARNCDDCTGVELCVVVDRNDLIESENEAGTDHGPAKYARRNRDYPREAWCGERAANLRSHCVPSRRILRRHWVLRGKITVAVAREAEHILFGCSRDGEDLNKLIGKMFSYSLQPCRVYEHQLPPMG